MLTKRLGISLLGLGLMVNVSSRILKPHQEEYLNKPGQASYLNTFKDKKKIYQALGISSYTLSGLGAMVALGERKIRIRIRFD